MWPTFGILGLEQIDMLCKKKKMQIAFVNNAFVKNKDKSLQRKGYSFLSKKNLVWHRSLKAVRLLALCSDKNLLMQSLKTLQFLKALPWLAINSDKKLNRVKKIGCSYKHK